MPFSDNESPFLPLLVGYVCRGEGFQTKFLGTLWFCKVVIGQLQDKGRARDLSFISEPLCFHLFYFKVCFEKKGGVWFLRECLQKHNCRHKKLTLSKQILIFVLSVSRLILFRPFQFTCFLHSESNTDD